MPDKFDPNKHLRTFAKQGEYLETKWRLVWLRSEQPGATVETEMVEHSYQEGFALFRASVRIPDGGSATGWGSETRQDFRDYLEKAETKALGRALAALGYGTQFAAELDEGERIADSPVQKPAQRPATANEASGKPEPKPAAKSAEPEPKQPEKAPLPDYLKAMWAAKTKCGWTDEQLRALMARRHPGLASTRDLTEDQAGALRSHMQRARVAQERMDQLWGVQEIADTLAEYEVHATVEMSDEQLTSLEALMGRARRDIGVVGELAQAMR